MKTLTPAVAVVAAAFCSFLAIDISPVFAEEMEVLVVRAQKRDQRLLDVGINVSSVSAEILERNRVESLTGLAPLLPNVDIKEQVAGAMPVITIRGVGLDDFSSTNNPSAGIYVDDVFLTSLALMGFDLYDIDRIEVMKGPQGTLFGRNTTAGAINVLTAEPQDDLDAYLDVGFGDYELAEAGGMVNIPVTDRFALRLSGKVVRQNKGYWHNRTTGNTVGTRDTTALRLKARYDVTDDTTLRLKLESLDGNSQMGQPEFFGTVDPLTGGPCAPVLAGKIDNTQCTDFLGYTDIDGDPYTGDWTPDSHFTQDQQSALMRIDSVLGNMNLSVISSYIDFNRSFLIDVDSTPANEVDFNQQDDISQWSHEIHLVGSSGPLDWVVGAFLSHDEVNVFTPGFHQHLFVTNTVIRADQETDARALFAHGEWHLNDEWKAVTGIRLSKEEKRYIGGTQDLNPFGASCLLSPVCNPGFVGPADLSFLDDAMDDSSTSWKLGLNWNPNSETLVYASVTSGTKSGGYFSGITTNNIGLAPYEPEEMLAWETGVKARLLDGTLDMNASVFYYDYENVQSFVRVDVGVVSVQRLSNIKQADVYGLDLDILWRPTTQLTIRGGLGLLDTELSEFNTLIGPVAAGNKLPNAPDASLNLGVSYVIPLTSRADLTVETDSHYHDAVFKEATNNPLLHADSYTLHNVRVRLDYDDSWSVSLWTRNIMDESYVVQALDTGIGMGNRSYNAPRTWGLTLGYRLGH